MLRSLASLRPNDQGWVVEVRVTWKSRDWPWKNTGGRGMFYDVLITDGSNDMQVVGFYPEANKFYNSIEADKVYRLSNCIVKNVDLRSSLSQDVGDNRIPYPNFASGIEMKMSEYTVIEECPDVRVPEIQYHFERISEIVKKDEESAVDVVGVCKEVGELEGYPKPPRLVTVRKVTIMDKSLTSIKLALFGEKAEDFPSEPNAIVTVRNAYVTMYQGTKSLRMVRVTLVKFESDINEFLDPQLFREAQELRQWFETTQKQTIEKECNQE